MQGKETGKMGKGISVIMNAIRGTLAAAGLTLCVFILLAFLISREYLPSSLMKEYVIATAFICMLAGGIHAAKREGRGVVTVGALAGVLYFLLILLMTAGIKNGSFGAMTIRMLVCSIGGGVTGGLLCAGQKTQKKKPARQKYNKK